MNKKIVLFGIIFLPIVCYASEPVASHVHEQAKSIINFYATSEQNKRLYQEDRYSIDYLKQGTLLSIFDGHSGAEVSSYLQNNFGTHFLQNMQKNMQKNDKFCVKTCMEQAFGTIEQYCLANYKGGSTALSVFIDCDNVLHCSWVGDSRAILIDMYDSSIVLASDDHKPLKEKEKKRIEWAGGKITFDKLSTARINKLAVSRSIGDKIAKQNGPGQIIALPDYEMVQLEKKPYYLVMASDGLWDVMTNDNVVDTINGMLGDIAPRYIASYLKDLAIRKKSEDNITVLVAELLAKD